MTIRRLELHSTSPGQSKSTALRARLRGIASAVPIARIYSSVLILYIIGISAFNRSFAGLHVSIGGIPIFVGEGTMALLLTLWGIGRLRCGAPRISLGPFGVGLLVYAVIGVALAIRGLVAGYGLAALRDFALVYYLVFFFFAAVYTQFSGQPRGLLRAIAVGASIGSVVSVVRFVAVPQLTYEHGASGALALLSWVAVVYIVLFRNESDGAVGRMAYLLAVIACMLTIFLAAYRTLLVSISASIAILWVLGLTSVGRRIPTVRSSAIILTALTLVASGFVAVLDSTAVEPSEPPLPEQRVSLVEGTQIISKRWVRGIASLVGPAIGSDPTGTGMSDSGPMLAPLDTLQGETVTISEGSLSFRLAAWRNAWHRISESPLTGIGFGPAPALHSDIDCVIAYSPISNCGNAHNTYLTLAMRMGIPAILYFLGMNGYAIVRFSSALYRRTTEISLALVGVVALVAYVSFGIYAFMSLFFESPYLSSLYWTLLAVMHFVWVRPLRHSNDCS